MGVPASAGAVATGAGVVPGGVVPEGVVPEGVVPDGAGVVPAGGVVPDGAAGAAPEGAAGTVPDGAAGAVPDGAAGGVPGCAADVVPGPSVLPLEELPPVEATIAMPTTAAASTPTEAKIGQRRFPGGIVRAPAAPEIVDGTLRCPVPGSITGRDGDVPMMLLVRCTEIAAWVSDCAYGASACASSAT